MSRLHYPKDKLEIIVINDNSSDRTAETVEEFAGKYCYCLIETIAPNQRKENRPF
jgi:glycosyltransferase involved in cell wall biosynthesis